ncbi:hypothetical protein DMH04_25555 [Kibdelosporangium aridum]|uniref:Uncharacterized protein n=1 Tax=Kibdelosporangium aridum TaxID=2030 RepID=A0A428Z694_KIBAR|nr:hypothetical protein DMH04_25555 [Kibdelosporangium aridum]
MLSFAIGFALQKFHEHRYEHPGLNRDSVEGYIDAWVSDGKAWKHCSGDFRLYLAVVATIFATWHDDRVSCTDEASWSNSIPWHVKHAFKNGDEPSTEIFDPYYFQCFAPSS